MIPVSGKKINNVKINKESIFLINNNKSKINKKTFIYDELTCINGTWEFNVITLI